MNSRLSMHQSSRRAAQKYGPPSKSAEEVEDFWQDDTRTPAARKTPGELFPLIELPKTRPATVIEKAQVAQYRALRKRIHEGPFFTVLDENARVGKTTSRRAAFNPFEDMPTYTKKYRPAVRKLPRFNTRRYGSLGSPRTIKRSRVAYKPADPKLFPIELLDIIDPNLRTVDGAGSKAKRRRTGMQVQQPANDEEGEEDAEDMDDAAQSFDEDEEIEEENPEDDFDEDDSEMGGDYNAEAYFDAGDDDLDVGDMDGGEDGGLD